MLLKIQETVTPADSKHHITYEFHLASNPDILHIQFTYSPKTLDDRKFARELIEQSIDMYSAPLQRNRLKENWERFYPLQNLLTLSVDDPDGHRGACHRHDPKQHLYLSEDSASPGLMPGPLKAGVWRVTLSVHAVVTPLCDYRLTVWSDSDTLAGSRTEDGNWREEKDALDCL